MSLNAAWVGSGAVHPLQCWSYRPGVDYVALCADAAFTLVGSDGLNGADVSLALQAVLKGELSDFRIEYECLVAEGRRIFSMEAAALGEGDRAGVVVMHTDITENRSTELGLHQSSALLQSVIDGVPDPFYVKDLEGRYLLCNRALADVANCVPQQMIGSDHLRIFGSENAEVLAQMENHVVATRSVNVREDVVQTETGPRTYLTTTAPYRGAGGTVIGVIGIAHDISVRKAAELDRDDERSTLRTLIDALPDLIYTKDMESRYVVTNRAAQLRFGDGSYAGMAGRTREELEPSPASSLAEEDDARVLAGHQVLDRVVSDVDAEGRRQWRLVIKVPLRNQASEITGLVGIERDITALRADQEALRTLNADLEARVTARTAEYNTARDEAEQANRAKSIFLANMSHEIRTPMNGVIGMLDVLHQTSLKGHQVEMVNLISESAFSLLAIIDDILDFSKMEAGKLSMERLPMHLAEVVEKACAMLDDIALKRGVRLTSFIDPAIPRIVMGDAGRLRQVLVNLTTNAIKFSGDMAFPGRVSARVLLVASQSRTVTVELALTDNGIGMDEETQARLFLPFTQADATTTRRFGGTGLGLAISNMLVGLMGGSISVQSRPGQGATFTVRLDLDLPDHGFVPETAGVLAIPARYCVVGIEQPLANDIAAHLSGPGCTVLQAADLVVAEQGPAASGGWTWVLLPEVTDNSPGDPQALRRQLSKVDDSTRFIVLGWGKRRHPRVEGPDLVLLDADNLSQRVLQEALTAARTGMVTATPGNDYRPGAEGTAISREEAIRRGRLILVAEDNETNRQVIMQQLRLSGHAADVVNNGREALDRWRTGDYALILTDLNMPVMDGYALTQAVRLAETASADVPSHLARSGTRIPIIAFTANASPQDGEQCKALGMDDYLVKPVRLADLVATLERWMDDVPLEAIPNAPLDLTVLAALVGDDPTVTHDILKSFLRTARDCQKVLHDAVKQGLPNDAAASLHSLKSAARSVGGEVLVEACGTLEVALAQQGVQGFTMELQTLDVALAEVFEWTENWTVTHPLT